MRSRLTARLGTAVLCAAILLPMSVGAQQDCLEPTAYGLSHLSVEPRADNALIADVTVHLDGPAPVYLEYGTEQTGWLRTPTAEAAQHHQLALLRMRPETTYQVRAVALDGAGCPAALADAEFTTGQLPDQLRSYQATATGTSSFPLTLMDWRSMLAFNVRVDKTDTSRWLAALDSEGQMVWYHRVPHDIPTPHSQIHLALIRRPNGNILYLSRSWGVVEITPDGREVRRIGLPGAAGNIHHEMVELPDGRVLLLGEDDRAVDDTANGGPVDKLLRGDTLHVLDLETGSVEQVWSAFEALDPTIRPIQWRGEMDQGVEVWTHANAVSLGPSGNVLISARRLDQVISLSPDLQSIEWRLGGPGSSFSFPDPADQFHGQHAVQQLPNGNILLFDNGNFRPEAAYSRGLELELDFSTMTARKVWEYRPNPDVYSDRIGNILRLPNGNTVVNFGFRADDPEQPSVLVEARPDGTAAYELTLGWQGMRASRYRAYPTESLAGEFPVEPTFAQRP